METLENAVHVASVTYVIQSPNISLNELKWMPNG